MLSAPRVTQYVPDSDLAQHQASSPMHGAPSCMLYVTLSGIWKVRCLHTLEAVAVCMRLTISQFDTLANDTTALFNTNLLHIAA